MGGADFLALAQGHSGVSIRIKSRLIMGEDGGAPNARTTGQNRFNPTQISAYYGGPCMGHWDCIFVDCFNPNQISAYYGGEKMDIINLFVRVSIRIKSRLIMGAAVSLNYDETNGEFQSESNLGLLWGPLMV